jgi:hypothetical protein
MKDVGADALTDGIAIAVYLESGLTPRVVEDSLAKLARSWSVKRLDASPEICEVFRRVRVPALVLYNSAKEETASAVGDLEIIRLIEATVRS